MASGAGLQGHHRWWWQEAVSPDSSSAFLSSNSLEVCTQGWGKEGVLSGLWQSEARVTPATWLATLRLGTTISLKMGTVVGAGLGGALLQRLDDGLLHVRLGVPHGQQCPDVVVPGGEGRQGAAAGAPPPSPLAQRRAWRQHRMRSETCLLGYLPLALPPRGRPAR